MDEKMPNNLEVGERIRKIREGLKMNREKFSEMIDISDVFLGQIERGERLLSLKTLCRIVSFTGVSTDFILFYLVMEITILPFKKLIEYYPKVLMLILNIFMKL